MVVAIVYQSIIIIALAMLVAYIFCKKRGKKCLTNNREISSKDTQITLTTSE